MVNTSVIEENEKPAFNLVRISEIASKEIYENITQCLCLARIHLSAPDSYNYEDLLARIGEANLLIGKAINDLRNLAKALMATKPTSK